jgi:hypothetical protein
MRQFRRFCHQLTPFGWRVLFAAGIVLAALIAAYGRGL